MWLSLIEIGEGGERGVGIARMDDGEDAKGEGGKYENKEEDEERKVLEGDRSQFIKVCEVKL